MTAPVDHAASEEASAAAPRPTERGASLVEYSMLIALIVIVCIAAVTLMGPSTASQFSSIADGLN